MSAPAINHAVSPSELIHLVDRRLSRLNSSGSTKAMLAPFVWGAPGIGKTEIVRQIAMSRGSRIVALHLPQFDPTDIKGIPVRMDDGTIRWVPSSYLPQEKVFYIGNRDDEVKLTAEFEYAVDIAIFVYDRDDELVSRFNDPTLPDVGPASFRIQNQGKSWSILAADLPEDAYKVVIEDKAIIFLDELSSADPSTQNAALQLVLDRRVGEYDVPSSSPVIAAGNREDDGAFVQTLSHPLCNRFTHYTLKPNADDWIEWAIYSKVAPEVIGLIKWDPDALFDYEPDALTNGHYGFATPRTWKFLSDQFEPIEFYKDMTNGDLTRAEALRMADFAGIVGQKRASQFVGYLQVMHDLPSPAEVISGEKTSIGDIERSKSFGLLYGLVFNLEHYFEKYYDDEKKPDQQGDEWSKARDNILDFITNNFDAESASWAVAVVMHKTGVEIKALRSEAFLRMSRKFVGVLSQIARKRD